MEPQHQEERVDLRKEEIFVLAKKAGKFALRDAAWFLRKNESNYDCFKHARKATLGFKDIGDDMYLTFEEVAIDSSDIAKDGTFQEKDFPLGNIMLTTKGENPVAFTIDFTNTLTISWKRDVYEGVLQKNDEITEKIYIKILSLLEYYLQKEENIRTGKMQEITNKTQENRREFNNMIMCIGHDESVSFGMS